MRKTVRSLLCALAHRFPKTAAHFSGCALASVALMTAGSALAWGPTGHRIIGEEAARALPAYMPEFLRSTQGIGDIGYFSNEPDNWKNSGRVHDFERDSMHYISLDDEGKTLAGVRLQELTASRSDFEALLRTRGVKPWNSGYLNYAIIDAWQQVVKDFAYWRVMTLLESKESDAKRKAWLKEALRRREALTLRDIGILSHYLGDASQPLHLTIHHNGWGKDYPNPKGYTLDPIHEEVESVFVSANISNDDVRGAMKPAASCTQAIEVCVNALIDANWPNVTQTYDLYKAGAFSGNDARGKAFAVARLAEGATNLRDLLNDAWRESKTMRFGYPGSTYEDVLAGRGDAWRALLGRDDR